MTDKTTAFIDKLICTDTEREHLKGVIDIFCDNLYDAVLPSGEKLMDNVFDIAAICVEEVGLSASTIEGVFLFPLVSNGVKSMEWIEKNYGSKNAGVIDGLVKISDFSPNKASAQADNFRKLLLNLAHDVRVILIKLAERLHTMRFNKHAAPELQLKLGHEAFYLYAPLAHRLGLYKVKSEMEDLALKFTEPDDYYDIAQKLNETADARNEFIADFIAPIKNKLEAQGHKFEIKGRPKSIYSIWNKVTKNGVAFDEVYDKFAIRIILDSEPEKEKADCWQVYSVVTEQYQPNPRRLRDWISVPKTNGYESLHTTVVVPGGKWVEVQIRTRRMDEVAEKGFAAHWMYKEGGGASGIDDWLAKVRDIMENSTSEPEEFIDDFKLALYTKEIFIFTPKGDLKKLPKGSTVLDFAFDIHSDIGSSCMGGKINGKVVPLRHELKNGDRVEIITAKNQRPKVDWLNYVVTGKAKSKLKNVLNEEKRKEAEIGKDIIKRRFKNWKIGDFDANISKLLKHYKLHTALEFYYQIAIDKINISEIKDIVQEDEEVQQQQAAPEALNDDVETIYHGGETLVIDKALSNVDYKLAKCCNPIFGDEIFGFVTIGEGIKIHRRKCPNATQMLSKYAYRVVNATWASNDSGTSYLASILISGYDEPGIFDKISEIIAKDPKMSMRSINMDTHDGMIEGKIKVAVQDISNLKGLISRLTQIKGVLKASRIES